MTHSDAIKSFGLRLLPYGEDLLSMSNRYTTFNEVEKKSRTSSVQRSGLLNEFDLDT
jgi:hypothetical protein